MIPTVKLISKCYVPDIDDLQLVINITKISRKNRSEHYDFVTEME